MVNTGILIGIVVGVFLAGIGIGYVIYTNTYSPVVLMQNPQFMQSMMSNQQFNQQLMGTMMNDPQFSQQMMNQSTGSMMSDDSNTMSGMMNQIPQDVTIKVTSGQVATVGTESKITLLILDKKTGKPLPDAQVIIGIERGASMTTMDMMGSMFVADDIGSGKYIVRFTPDRTGYYTMHTHVIPAGKSMHSMMNNHLDIGIIVK